MNPSMSDNRNSQSSVPRLLLGLTVIGVIWLVVLPRIATVSAVDERLRFLDSNNIDASAMFYTELDVMDGILDRIENQND